MCVLTDLGGARALQDRRPVRPPAGRAADLVEDVRWVRRHFLPWVSRRLRGVSSGDGVSPKHLELVDVLPPTREA